MIPKKIHQLWIPPAHLESIPGDVLPQTRAWKDLHLDFEHKIWKIEEISASLPTRQARRMMEAIEISRFEAMKADIARLYLLFEFGGFWSDLKVSPLRNWLSSYLSYDLILIEHFPFDPLPDPTGVLTNNFIGAAAGNAFIEACIEQAHINIENRVSTSIWDIAGPRMFMKLFSEWKARTQACTQTVVLPWQKVWNELIAMGHGSYSSDARHWSVREKKESIYLEFQTSPGPDLSKN